MANNNINVLQTLIQLRRGTEEQWNLVKDTFIPCEGEPCTTIYDDGRDALIKIGDGKHTWGQLGYTRDSFLVTLTQSESGEFISDKTREEIIEAVEQNKNVWAKRETSQGTIFAPLIGLQGEKNDPVFESVTMGMKLVFTSSMGIIVFTAKYMTTSDVAGGNFSAQNQSILNLEDSNELSSAVTKQYTDNSTPTFIYLEEQNGAIKSKVTDLNTLKTALMSQTNGYTQTSNPLYKAIKCYAMLNGNCYDLIYSSQEPQGTGKTDIIKRTFYAVTSDGLNKLNVVIDENQTDENQKVVWTKEAQGVAAEQFVVTITDVDGVSKSDKTPAEIKAAAKAGKQVILQRTYGGKIQTAYLVSIMDKVAAFCFIGDYTGEGALDFLPYDKMLVQEWVSIDKDKTVKTHSEAHIPAFLIEEGANSYTSTLSPIAFLQSMDTRNCSNAFFKKKEIMITGTFYRADQDSSGFHFYFPDYKNNKLYDLKWNEDENPSTYTFTELTLGEKPMIVNFTITDPHTLQCTADKTFAEVDAAYKKGIPIYGKLLVDEEEVFFTCSYSHTGTYCFISAIGIETRVRIGFMYVEFDDSSCKLYVRECMGRISLPNSDWDAENKPIKNIGSPTEASDAATKGYVDTSLAAKTEQFIVTATTLNDITKSDKTLAEIMAAAGEGKQVVLKEDEQTSYLVSVSPVSATFLSSTVLPYEPNSLVMQAWSVIVGDQTVITNVDSNLETFIIRKDGSGKYGSHVNPNLLMRAVKLRRSGQYILLYKDLEVFIGTIYQDAKDVIHIYFPDYAKGKVYDLKWNGDDPATYTFTELNLGEKPMVVTFTVTDLSTFSLKADTPYADIKKAADEGRIVYASVPKASLFGTLSSVTSNRIYFSGIDSSDSTIITIKMSSDSDIHAMKHSLMIGPFDQPILNADDRKITNVLNPTDAADAATKAYADNILIAGNSDSVVIKSSTPNSTKKFRITVDDAGAISATEVVS